MSSGVAQNKRYPLIVFSKNYNRSVFVVPKFAITVENNHIVPNCYNDMGRWYKDRMKSYSDQICWVNVTQIMVTCKN